MVEPFNNLVPSKYQQRIKSRVNPDFFSGAGYSGPFSVNGDTNGSDEPILTISHGRFHIGTVTVEIEDNINSNAEFGPFESGDLPSNPAILSLDIYSYSGVKFRFGLYNPNSFGQQPGEVYLDGSTPTDALSGTALLDGAGDPVLVPTYRKALAYVTFQEVDDGDPLTTNLWEPTEIEQWWQAGDIDVPRVGRGSVV